MTGGNLVTVVLGLMERVNHQAAQRLSKTTTATSRTTPRMTMTTRATTTTTTRDHVEDRDEDHDEDYDDYDDDGRRAPEHWQPDPAPHADTDFSDYSDYPYGERPEPLTEAFGAAPPPLDRPPGPGPQHGGDWEGGEWTGSHRAIKAGRRGVSVGVVVALVTVVVVVGAVILWRFFGDALSHRTQAGAARCVSGDVGRRGGRRPDDRGPDRPPRGPLQPNRRNRSATSASRWASSPPSPIR